ncbi:hypothetical protein FB567DRAFT_236859 [Paraphoma chrysanthemicola]|uniref:Secreted protein n=1 Tax=Paraphoma chrysanthemicola TaxID=798071 RepID=A0A8K0RGU6_9PLEO|nr:hypothetical protein FB567DRAFT_236859 [Paraphoma chrysanthemicola]
MRVDSLRLLQCLMLLPHLIELFQQVFIIIGPTIRHLLCTPPIQLGTIAKSAILVENLVNKRRTLNFGTSMSWIFVRSVIFRTRAFRLWSTLFHVCCLGTEENVLRQH